jgi:hypothetical protein
MAGWKALTSQPPVSRSSTGNVMWCKPDSVGIDIPISKEKPSFLFDETVVTPARIAKATVSV